MINWSFSVYSLAPLYFSAQVLWVLIGFSSLGIFLTLCRVYLNVDLLQELCSALSLVWRGGYEVLGADWVRGQRSEVRTPTDFISDTNIMLSSQETKPSGSTVLYETWMMTQIFYSCGFIRNLIGVPLLFMYVFYFSLTFWDTCKLKIQTKWAV